MPADGNVLSTGRFICGMLSPFSTDSEKNSLLASHASSIDTHALARFLRGHRLEAFACHALLPFDPDRKLGDALHNACEKAATLCAVKAKAQLPILSELLSAATQDGLSILVIKGPAIVERIHDGDFGRRPFSDIDLAIRPHEVARFLGLAMRKFKGRSKFQFENATSRLHLQIGLVVFEVHWDLSLFYAFNRNPRRGERQVHLWNRAITVSSEWGDFQTLSAVDSIAHQAAHSILQHDLNAHVIFHALDFALSIKKLMQELPALTATEFKAVADEQGYPLALQVMAMATKFLFPGAENFAPLNWLSANAPQKLETYVSKEVLEVMNGREEPTPRNLRDMTIAMATFMNGGDNRIRFLRQVILPSRYVLSETLKRKLSPTEYMFGLFRHAMGWQIFFPVFVILLHNQVQRTAK